jgi:hypothetical protein
MSMGPGRKDDNGKIRMDLIPMKAVQEIAKVLTFGADKYGSNNWQNVAPFESRYYAALLRHLTAWRAGEVLDPETGLAHLAHAGCCLLFLLSRACGLEPALDEPSLEELERGAEKITIAWQEETTPIHTYRILCALHADTIAPSVEETDTSVKLVIKGCEHWYRRSEVELVS